MKVALHIVEARRRKLAEFLQAHAYAPLRDVCERFDVSAATARRDLAVLAARKQIVRTYGGALTEYSQRFPSFRERAALHARRKRRIAAAAYRLIESGQTCFLDFGTTIYALAQELKRQPVENLRVVTNNLPAAELLSEVPQMRVHLLGGEIVSRQSALLGETACRAIAFHAIDIAFLGAEAADREGVWNSHEELTVLQRASISQAGRTVLCLDASKIERSAPAFLASWEHFDLLITNRGVPDLSFAKCRQTLV